MEGFWAFIFWCILIFYVGGIVVRWLLRRWIRKKAEQFQAGYGAGTPPPRSKKHEGDVTVERIEVKEKQVSGKVGEYVEYEEVDK